MTNTATVETLTAEVRVLMVGSRQVTLSVAKQLDVVPLESLTIFGRVNLNDGYRRVIGADRNGNLALATVAYPDRGEWGSDMYPHVKALYDKAQAAPLIVLAGLR